MTYYFVRFSREDKLSLRDRSMITISALRAQGLFAQTKITYKAWNETRNYKRGNGRNGNSTYILYMLGKSMDTFPIIDEIYNSKE